MRALLTICFALAVTAALFPQSLFAAPNDLTLWRMCRRDPATGNCLPAPGQIPGFPLRADPDVAKWKKFTKEFSSILGPKYHSSADSLGMLGFNVGLEYSMNFVPTGPQWNDALENVETFENWNPDGSKSSTAPTQLSTFQFHVRKGLPYSFEIGFNGSYILASKMFLVGSELKVTFIEDLHEYAPDVAARMTYGHLFGAPDMDLDLTGWDLSLSWKFGLGGFVQMAPYTGYSLLVSYIKPKVVNPDFYGKGADQDMMLLLLPHSTDIQHRWFVGLKINTAYLTFIPEFQVSSTGVKTVSFNLGSEF